MGLWILLEGFLLLANALAVLNEDRFLAPRGWSFSEFSGGRTKSFKGPAYRPYLCNSVPESSSHTAQHHLHNCKVGFWMNPNQLYESSLV